TMSFACLWPTLRIRPATSRSTSSIAGSRELPSRRPPSRLLVRVVAVGVAVETPAPRATASGARSGVLLAGATGASIVAAYVFLLAAGRILGSEDYGSLAALLGLLAVVLIPASALQMAVSRVVSRRIAAGHPGGAAALARSTVRLSLIATVPLVALAFALAVPFARLLHIH